jgi:hypothetical protein
MMREFPSKTSAEKEVARLEKEVAVILGSLVRERPDGVWWYSMPFVAGGGYPTVRPGVAESRAKAIELLREHLGLTT